MGSTVSQQLSLVVVWLCLVVARRIVPSVEAVRRMKIFVSGVAVTSYLRLLGALCCEGSLFAYLSRPFLGNEPQKFLYEIRFDSLY